LGNGNSKLFYLPEVHTDFIFALIGEELGFVGCFALILFFCAFGYLLLKVSLYAKEPFARYLSLGLAVSLLLQIAVNIGGVTGLIPIKGLTLPFFSWGRSALLVHLASIGILLSVLRSSVNFSK
jgi:cell division protein FtsW